MRARTWLPAVLLSLAWAFGGCSDEPASGPAGGTDPETDADATVLDVDDASDGADDGESPDGLETDIDLGDADNGGTDTGARDGGREVGPRDASDDRAPDARPDATDRRSLRVCQGSPFAFTPSDEWEHPVLTGAIAWQDPGHSVEDLIATLPFATLEVEGKFAYGTFGNDLEDEYVVAFLDTCEGWAELGRGRTDSDGRVRFEVSGATLPGPGRYAVKMAVEGDGSQANGWLLAVPAGTSFVVFDIDGTLTTGDSELFADYIADLFGGDFVPEAYEGAVDVVNAYAWAGYEILYLTGRPYWLDAITRGWLDDEGFPLGTVHLTRSLSESLPSQGGVGTYKRDYLLRVDADHAIFRAYGNADTDIWAYREAGIPLEATFIIGDNAGAEGTQAISSYPEHLATTSISPATQPWE